MPEIILTIKMQEDGSINVSGPIGNKTICYGMIEAAKDAVRDYVEANQSRIVPAVMLPKGN